jgi:hypothetical protein
MSARPHVDEPTCGVRSGGVGLSLAPLPDTRPASRMDGQETRTPVLIRVSAHGRSQPAWPRCSWSFRILRALLATALGHHGRLGEGEVGAAVTVAAELRLHVPE